MRALVLSVLAAATVAIGCVWACLPDIEITPYLGPVCGDGIISPDAGEQCDPGPDASPQVLATTCTDRCRVVCDAGSPFLQDPVSNHCYFVLSSSQDQSAAASGCEGKVAHLVRFVSENEVSFVSIGGTYWVGLDDQVTTGTWLPIETTNEPGWSAQCPGCFANIRAGSTAIPSLHDAGDPRCAVGYPGAATDSWERVACDVADWVALCEREPPGSRTASCAAGSCFTVAATLGAKSYILLGLPRVSASTAAQACAGLDGGLVVFQSREEREQIGYEIGTETARGGGANDFWLGLSLTDAGAWVWDHEGGLEPLPWGENEPGNVPPLAGPTRAHVFVNPGTIDSELARTTVNAGDDAGDDAGETHYAVCEFR